MSLTVALAWAILAGPVDAPRCLIVQNELPGKDDINPNLMIANLFASETEKVGRVLPIVWSTTDPIFREAAFSGTITIESEKPTLEQVRVVARELKAEYILWFEAVRQGPASTPTDTPTLASGRTITVRASLLRNGRETWKDTRNVPISQGTSFDPENDARSAARTLYILLETGPWKDLPPRAVLTTPPADPGELAPKPVTPTIAPAAAPDPAPRQETLARIAKMRESGQWSLAIATLRDEIDRSPLDAQWRTAYVELLLAAGQPELAMVSAQTAANTVSDPVPFRVMASHAALAISDLATAQAELNEAIARQPDNPAVRLGLAKVALLRGEPTVSATHLAAVPASHTESMFYRAVTDMLLGKATPVSGSPSVEEYLFVATVLDDAATSLTERIRTSQQRAIVRRDDPTVRASLEEAQRIGAAASAMLRRGAPSLFTSHARRLLAWTLLVQSLGDFDAYVKDGDEDAITESRIGLGEAIKHLTALRTLLRDERKAADARKLAPPR